MTKPRYRFEYKYFIAAHTAAILRARAQAVMRPDAHHGGTYTVHNLYLDDRYDSFYYARYLGRLCRDKYRLRFYNGNMDFIRLERKHKDGIRSYKDTTPVTREQYQRIRDGDLAFLLEENMDQAIWHDLGVIYRLRGLRPTTSFAYRREAYTYLAGDVRITFDSPPFDPDPGKADRPVMPPCYDPLGHNHGRMDYHPLLLEVKFSGFLPEVIKRLLDGLPLQHTSMSKYCLVRERGLLPYGKT